MEWWLARVSREKIVMGLPAYSNDYCSLPHYGGANGTRPHVILGGGFEQREQSEPGVSGHGKHAPALQLPGEVQLSCCSPTLQPQSKSPGW